MNEMSKQSPTESDYRQALFEIVSMIRAKAAYLKEIDPRSNEYDPKVFEGMTQAYYWVLDGIKSYVANQDDITLEDVGLDDFDPNEVMRYPPRTRPRENPP